MQQYKITIEVVAGDRASFEDAVPTALEEALEEIETLPDTTKDKHISYCCEGKGEKW